MQHPSYLLTLNNSAVAWQEHLPCLCVSCRILQDTATNACGLGQSLCAGRCAQGVRTVGSCMIYQQNVIRSCAKEDNAAVASHEDCSRSKAHFVPWKSSLWFFKMEERRPCRTAMSETGRVHRRGKAGLLTDSGLHAFCLAKEQLTYMRTDISWCMGVRWWVFWLWYHGNDAAALMRYFKSQETNAISCSPLHVLTSSSFCCPMCTSQAGGPG